MKSKLLDDGDEKTFVIVFDAGDEVVAGLLDFAKEHKLAGGRLTGLGACEEAAEANA